MKRGKDPLIEAVRVGNIPLIKKLISSGHPVDATNQDRCTALHVVLSTTDNDPRIEQILKLLIKNGANPTIRDRNGWTPLHSAAQFSSFSNGLFLVRHCKLDVTEPNKDGTTALHYLARRKAEKAQMATHLELLRGMVSLGANVNAQTYIGESPLHQSSLKGNVHAGEFLVQAGADLHLLSRQGDTALHYAIVSGQEAMAEYLLSMGTDVATLAPLETYQAIGISDTLFNLLESRSSRILSEGDDGEKETVSFLFGKGEFVQENSIVTVNYGEEKHQTRPPNTKESKGKMVSWEETLQFVHRPQVVAALLKLSLPGSKTPYGTARVVVEDAVKIEKSAWVEFLSPFERQKKNPRVQVSVNLSSKEKEKEKLSNSSGFFQPSSPKQSGRVSPTSKANDFPKQVAPSMRPESPQRRPSPPTMPRGIRARTASHKTFRVKRPRVESPNDVSNQNSSEQPPVGCPVVSPRRPAPFVLGQKSKWISSPSAFQPLSSNPPPLLSSSSFSSSSSSSSSPSTSSSLSSSSSLACSNPTSPHVQPLDSPSLYNSCPSMRSLSPETTGSERFSIDTPTQEDPFQESDEKSKEFLEKGIEPNQYKGQSVVKGEEKDKIENHEDQEGDNKDERTPSLEWKESVEAVEFEMPERETDLDTGEEESTDQGDRKDSATDLRKCLEKASRNSPISYEIMTDEVEMGQKIAEGTSGKVLRGSYRCQDVAIKILKKKMDARQMQDFVDEFTILATLRSPFVVYFYGICVEPQMSLVMEYCCNGSVYEVLNRKNLVFDWGLFMRMSQDMARGLLSLHAWVPQILHRDVKSLNYLVDANWVTKVSDFGLSRHHNQSNRATLGKVRGTFAYSAPEVYAGNPHTSKSDIYSLAIVLWELVHRIIVGKYSMPYKEYKNIQFDFQILLKATTGLRPTIPESCPENLKNVIQMCWDPEPDRRPEARELLFVLQALNKEFADEKRKWRSTAKDLEEYPGDGGENTRKTDITAFPTVHSDSNVLIAETQRDDTTGQKIVKIKRDTSPPSPFEKREKEKIEKGGKKKKGRRMDGDENERIEKGGEKGDPLFKAVKDILRPNSVFGNQPKRTGGSDKDSSEDKIRDEKEEKEKTEIKD